LYRAVMQAAAALQIPSLLLRGREEERREREGESPSGGTPDPLWIHAASLGETAAAANLVRVLRAQETRRLAISAMTRTGRARAQAMHPDVGPFFFPLDAPKYVKRALDRVHPDAIVVLETEIWPNLLRECARRDIPWGIASARMSARAHGRYRVVRGALRSILSGASAIAARSAEDADRFLDLGARSESVRVTGDLKECREVAEYSPPPAEPFVWIAACTRPGEEEIVLDAARIIEGRAGLVETWIAPRHPQRFEEVGALLTRRGAAWRCWKDRDQSSPGSILLIDEIGVLDEAYRRASCAFIGGSLLPYGGHNPLEAAAWGRAILFGPHTQNCRRAAEALAAGGAARRVSTAQELADEVSALARDSQLCEERGRAARGFAARASRAAPDTLAFLRERGVLR
jgi:3-deoxy-D-manno-octulosonic-acid transferase